LKATRKPPAASAPRAKRPRGGARWAVVRFVVIFLVLAGAAVVAETMLMQRDALRGYREFLARAASYLTGAVGVHPRVSGDELMASGRGLKITTECTATFATGAYWAAVIGLWCPWRRTLVGLFVGVVGVAMTNILRIAMLILFAAWAKDLFTFAHDVLMQGYLLLMVTPLWAAWAVWAVRPAKTPTRAPVGLRQAPP
jgi:exosortase/archaeosortase family protein